MAAACPSYVILMWSHLGDAAGLFQDGEAGAENLSSGVVLHWRVGGQSDRSQSNQIGIPGMDQHGDYYYCASFKIERAGSRIYKHLASHGFLLEANKMKSLPLSPFLTHGVATR